MNASQDKITYVMSVKLNDLKLNAEKRAWRPRPVRAQTKTKIRGTNMIAVDDGGHNPGVILRFHM